MSWDGYLDTLVGYGKGNIDRGAIIGLDGSQWTTSGHAKAMQPTDAEAATIASTIKNGNISNFQANGCTLQGVKYRFLRNDEEDKTYLFKQKDQGALTLQQTSKAIIIAHIKEGMSQGTANSGISKLADYLKGAGY